MNVYVSLWNRNFPSHYAFQASMNTKSLWWEWSPDGWWILHYQDEYMNVIGIWYTTANQIKSRKPIKLVSALSSKLLWYSVCVEHLFGNLIISGSEYLISFGINRFNWSKTSWIISGYNTISLAIQYNI